VQVAVGKITGRLDGAAPVQAAAVQPVDVAGLQVGRGALAAGHVFKAFGVLLDHAAAHAGHVGMRVQEGQGLFQEAFAHLHVAVEDVDKVTARMLVAQLRARAAAALLGVGQLHDAYRVGAGELHRAVAGVRVRQDHLAAHAGHGAQARFPRSLQCVSLR
jgi:hypothetical protein